MSIERTFVYRLTCDCCHAIGPTGMDPGVLVQEASLCGWEIVFRYCICPTCTEQGRLPEGISDVVVGLPMAAPAALWPGYPDQEHFGSPN